MCAQNWAFLKPPSSPNMHYDIIVTIKQPLLHILWADPSSPNQIVRFSGRIDGWPKD